MGELVNLSEWKQKRDLDKVKMLKEEVDQLIEYLAIKREFFMFDSLGRVIKINKKDDS